MFCPITAEPTTNRTVSTREWMNDGVVEHVGEIGEANKLWMLCTDTGQRLVGERDVNGPDDRPGEEDNRSRSAGVRGPSHCHTGIRCWRFARSLGGGGGVSTPGVSTCAV